MIKFIDGPARGIELNLRRAPKYLRVVIDDSGIVDALDQKQDVAKPNEKIFAYVMTLQGATRFRCGTKRGCIVEVDAQYRYCNKQPSDKIARNLKSWEIWVEQMEG